MKIEKLNYFLTAAEYLNFSKAAEACHIAQPAISKQIHSLEQELGFPLFIRFGHCVKLTPAGHHFYRSISAFMEDYRESFCRAGRQIHAGKPQTKGLAVMLLDRLDYFISAARLGSFTKAAQEWDVMQSTISQSIASLEQELQCPLFIRGAKGVSLTERGQIFFLDALRLKKSFEQAVTSARALESPGKKGLTIRLSSFMDSLPLLEPLSRLKNSDPDLELSFSLGDDSNWDLALIRMPETENRYSEWEYFPFGEKKLMVLIPPNHPLLGIPFLTLEILSQFSERLYLTQNAYDMAGSFLSPEKSFLLSEDSLLAPVCLVNRCPGLDMRWDSGSFLPGLTSQEIQGCDMRQAQCFQYSLCNTNPAITDFLSCLEMV